MVDTLHVISDDDQDGLFPLDHRVLMGLAVASLLVLVMVAVVITYNNIKTGADDFRRDCERFDGVVHELGDETICMVGNQVVGRH